MTALIVSQISCLMVYSLDGNLIKQIGVVEVEEDSWFILVVRNAFGQQRIIVEANEAWALKAPQIINKQVILY